MAKSVGGWSPRDVVAAGVVGAAELLAHGDRWEAGPRPDPTGGDRLAPSTLGGPTSVIRPPLARLRAELLTLLDLASPGAAEVRAVLLAPHRSAADFLAALEALPDMLEPSDVRRSRHQRRHCGHGLLRRVTGALLGLSLLAAAAVAGWTSVGSPRIPVLTARAPAPLLRPAPPAPVALRGAVRTTPLNWVTVLEHLEAARVRGLAGTGPLTRAEIAGSPAEWVDAGRARWLRQRRLHPAGLDYRVLAARTGSLGAARAVLLVRDAVSAYRLVGPAGRTWYTVAARGPRWWREWLRLTPAGWRLFSVSPAPLGGPRPGRRSGT